MFSIEGLVTEILDYGFVLDGTTTVSTMTKGKKLGLRRGDRVVVRGGPGGPKTFLSSSATKTVLFGRVTIDVPVNEHDRRSWLFWL